MLAVSQPVSTIFQPQMMRELPLVSLASASKQIRIAGERRGEAGHRGTKRRVLRYLARSDAND